MTNVWQLVMGPAFGPLIRRPWPIMLAICAGPLLSVAWLTGGESDGSVTALGIALVPILPTPCSRASCVCPQGPRSGCRPGSAA